MGKRIRLGLIFSVDENWIGGTYYILNLISALGTLPDEKQPHITILSKNKSDLLAAQKTGYRFLDYENPFEWKRNLGEAAINKLGKIFSKKDIIEKRISFNKIDVLFPASNDPCFDMVRNKVYWFPDFQHIYYPEYFTTPQLQFRQYLTDTIAASSQKLVVSSIAARRDWESFDQRRNCSVHVIPFAVSHPTIDYIDINELLEEFNIGADYFIVSNQFWKHKNHLVVLRAAKELGKKGLPLQFVFTGKKEDDTTSSYFKSIQDYINENHLNSMIKMLGLIDRSKQLRLMQYSKGVIQPSLFEGWSTVVEDGKSLGKYVIASDIPVHREQLPGSEYLFDANNEWELVEKIKMVLSKPQFKPSNKYKENITLFGQQFLTMIETF